MYEVPSHIVITTVTKKKYRVIILLSYWIINTLPIRLVICKGVFPSPKVMAYRPYLPTLPERLGSSPGRVSKYPGRQRSTPAAALS